ncbi:MAG: hypothetical protein ACTSUK_07270, partial [Promethearchaeota archaeon]
LYPKIKRVQIVLIKNLFEALICSSGIFLISSFYHSFNMSISILFLYFFVASFIITIIFDIKDIKGDFWDNIYTFPLQYGIKKTKIFCILLNVLLSLFLVNAVFFRLLPVRALLLLGINGYILGYILFAPSKKKQYHYSLFVNEKPALLLFVFFTI